MRIAFCDDEEALALTVRDLAEAWERRTGEECRLSVFRSGEEFLFENPESYPYDLILLDIQMEKLDGISLAKQIRERDEQVVLAFLTNCGEYVFAGYEVLAARYLMKPLREEQFFELLDFARSRQKKEKRYLICAVQGETVKVDLDEIMFCEAQKHYVRLRLSGGRELQIKYNFSDLERELSDGGCVPAHRSYLVNLSYVERITRAECILSDGGSVPVSRSRYRELNEAFIRYYRQEKGGVLL